MMRNGIQVSYKVTNGYTWKFTRCKYNIWNPIQLQERNCTVSEVWKIKLGCKNRKLLISYAVK